MQRNIHILEELNTIAPNIPVEGNVMPYGVPEGYFTLLPTQMLMRAQVQSNPVGAVPELYFENFATQMLQKIKALEQPQELIEAGSLLNSISKNMPFTVPEGYFESLIKSLPLEREFISETAVVSIASNKKTMWQWAVAATIIITLGLTYWWTTQPENVEAPVAQIKVLEEVLAETDEEVMTAYLSEEENETLDFAYFLVYSGENLEESMQQISTETIEQYLNNTSKQIAL